MTSTPRPRSFWQRHVPPRVRQHALMLGASLATLAAVLLLLSTAQLRPIVFSQAVLEPPAIAENIAGAVDLFDPGRPHTLTIAVGAVEFQEMVDDFREDGTKTWIRADATIDGATIGSVGIRLKGNSTLGALRPRTGAPGGGPGSGEGPGPPGGPGGMPSASFDDPSTLPLLLSFHKFVRGRGYQGHGEFAVRPATTDGTSLNEAVALQLIREAGEPSQRAAWVAFSINGSEPRTRLVIENPDQSYAESLGLGPGALFKSTSANRFTYLGEDATAYADDFSQLSGRGVLDLAPVIGLLKFVAQSDDAAFAEELPRRLDVASLARYVAIQDLLGNFDDMAGPGRNFLLWYGADDGRFRVLAWDMNLAIGAMPFGPGRGPGAGPPREGASGGRPPGEGRPGGRMRHGNRLKERFVAAPAFAELRAQARAELVAAWFTRGRAAQLSRELAAHIPRVRAGDDERVAAELAKVLADIERLATSAAAA